jgi:multiple sugar transport system permease protein
MSESTTTHDSVPEEGYSSFRKRQQIRTAMLMSAPAVVLLAVFLVTPFIMAIVFSVTNQRLVPNVNLSTQFIGLRNYLRLFGDPSFGRAILNNLYFAVVVVPLQSAFALALAMLIDRKIPGIKIFRAIYFSPVVITMVVVSIVWYLLYNPEQGFINRMLKTVTFGAFPTVRWLSDTKTAMPAIMILSIWQGVGFQMVIFLAGLQDIPDQLYEVCDIDGGTWWQKFRYVTVPQLRNTILFVAISTTILAFKLFQQVWVMTQGGPQESTLTSIVFMYRRGFQQGKVGMASATAVLFFLMVLVISIVQRTVLKEERETD